MPQTAETTNKYGLSKKTNIALAGIAAIATAKDSTDAVIAIAMVTLVCVALQYYLDYTKTQRETS
jgi:hypothetical protein